MRARGHVELRCSPARNIPASILSARLQRKPPAKLGIELSYFPYTSRSVLPARDLTELEASFRAIVEDRCDALVASPNSAMYRDQRPHCPVRVGNQAALCLRLVFVREQGFVDDLRT